VDKNEFKKEAQEGKWMKKKPKLAYVTHYYPYRGGYGNNITNQIKYLSNYFDIHFFYFFKKNSALKSIDISKFIKKEYLLKTGFRQIVSSTDLSKNMLSMLFSWKFIYNMAKNSMLHGIPLYFAPYYTESSTQTISKVIKKENIRYLWAYSIFGGGICKDMKLDYKLLYLCDSLGYLYHNLLKIEKNPAMKLFMIWNQLISTAHELEIKKHYDTIAFINRIDGEWLNLKAGEYAVLPLIRKKTPFRSAHKKYDIVLAGHWDYLPNADSLEYAIDAIFPKLKRKCSVLVVGINLNKRLRQRLSTANNVRIDYRENVDDYFGAISSAKIFLIPIRAGAGICNKLLDGLETRLPVLVTPFLKNGHDKCDQCPAIISCNDGAEFANHIEQLLDDAPLRKRLGAEGKRFYFARFSNAEKEYEKAVKRMLGNRKRCL